MNTKIQGAENIIHPFPKAGKGRDTMVVRSRLLNLMKEISLHPLIVVQASAGYGKTVLLRQWHKFLTDRGTGTGWLLIAEEDNDPKILIPKILERITSEQGYKKNIKQNSVYLVSDADSMVRQISQPQGQFVFFLDDFDKLHDHQAINLIRTIIAQYWQDFTIVVATRKPPRLGLAKMRVSGELLELGPDDLCFNMAETKQFFEEKKIEYDDIAHKTTEGWPAAIQLAALVLKKGDIKSDKVIDIFSSPWAEMNDYFSEEILGPQENDIQKCLLETGLLERFTIELATVVTGNKNIHKEIEQILKLGLLLAYEGYGNIWLRYHPLFAAFLEEKLKQSSQTRFEEIHRGAALWHRENGQISDSIRHAFAAGDISAAAALLSQASVERKRVGRFRSFTSWTSQLPGDMLDNYPELRIEAACSYAALFELEAARTHINSVKPHYKDLSPKARDDLFAVDAMMAVYADRPDVTIETSLRGLRDCIEYDPYTLGTLKHTLAIGQIAGGNISEARHNIHEGQAYHEKAESDFGVAVSYSLKGLSYAVEGDLTQVMASWVDAEKIIDDLPTSNAIRAIAIGYLPETLYERNELAQAEEYVALCFASSIEIAIPDMVTTLYLTAARIAFAKNNLDKANTLMDQAEVIGLRRGWPRLVYAILWERIRFALYRGRTEEARRLRDQSEKGRPYEELKGFIPHAVETEANKIGALRLESRLNPGRKLLADLRVEISGALAENRIWRTIRLLIIEAFTREAMNDRRAALRVLRRALELGANGHFVRSFIEEGPQIINLVKIVFDEERRAPATIKIEYLEAIIEASGGEFSSANTNDSIIEALSKRELDVLTMLATGLSNKELADRLFVSEHTVKWHLQHIFEKLEVKNRTRAITIAREHGLIG